MKLELLLAVCVVLSGCGAAASPEADNPWNEQTVEVAVVAPDGEHDRWSQLTREELDHWENNSQEYAGSNVSFAVVDNPESADLVIQYRETVTCDGNILALGCARVSSYEGSEEITTAQVAVKVGTPRFGNDDVQVVLRHEIGHVFGLNHTDAGRLSWMRESRAHP